MNQVNVEQKAVSEKICYVLFFRLNDEKVTILFVKEFQEGVDAEESKCQINNSKERIHGCDAAVGICYFKGGLTHDSDVIVIKPKDGSPEFVWSDMIDISEVLEEVKEDTGNVESLC